MARKQLPRSLPPLATEEPFAESDRKADKLINILRDAAMKHRTNQPQVFYALRDVAKQFHVPLSLVATVYGRLEGEGLLTRLRGSKTLLKAVNSSRQIAVHAIVVIPMALPEFIVRRKCRLFFVHVQRALRQRGFATANVFYDAAEARPEFLAKQLRECNADSVLWYMPDRSARNTTLLLADAGVPVVGICDGGNPGISCRYEIRRENAFAEILRDWKSRSRITHAVIVRAAKRSAADEERISATIESEGLSIETVTLEQDEAEPWLRAAERAKSTGVVLTDSAASLFGFRTPERLRKLMTLRRVALFDGFLSLPFAAISDAEADVVAVDWDEFASTVADDFLKPTGNGRSGSITIDARPRIRSSLAEFADAI